MMDRAHELQPLSAKSNIELGFVGRNETSDAINLDECKAITKDHEIGQGDGYEKRYTFEEAIRAAGHGKFHYFALLAAGTSLVALVAELIGIGYSAPAAKCDVSFSMTTSQQGVLNSIAFFGFVCSSHLWGFLSDTWGRHKSLRLALILTFIFSATSSLSVTIAMLIATRFFVGFCIAGIQSSALPYLGEFHSNETRARAITFASMCMTMSVGLMSLISWAVIPMKWSFSLGFIMYTPWRFNIMCSSLISLVAFLMLGFLPESPKFLLSLGKERASIDALKQIYRINRNVSGRDTVSSKNICLDDQTDGESVANNLADASWKNMLKLIWDQSWPLFVGAHLKNMLVISYLSSVLYGIAHGMNMWLPHIFNVLIDYMDKSITICDVIHSTMGKASQNAVESGNSTSTSALECSNTANPLTFKMMLLFGISLILVYVLVGIFIKWITIRTITTVGLIASTVSGAALIWSKYFYLSYLFTCILLSCGNFASLVGGLSQDLFPTNLKSMAVCFIFMFGRIGSVAGSNLIGLLITTNCTLVLIIYVVLLSSCAILCQLFLKTSSRK